MNKEILKFSQINPEKILNDLGFTKPSFNPFEVAEKMKIDVSKDRLYNLISEDIEGHAFVENGEPKIWINPFLHENRQRFTLAHEIGHVVWDILPALKEKQNHIEFDDYGTFTSLSFNHDGQSNYTEYKANDFAGRLLMPESYMLDALINLLNEYKNKGVEFYIKEMSKKFKVSTQAMTVRLLRLDLIEQ